MVLKSYEVRSQAIEEARMWAKSSDSTLYAFPLFDRWFAADERPQGLGRYSTVSRSGHVAAGAPSPQRPGTPIWTVLQAQRLVDEVLTKYVPYLPDPTKKTVSGTLGRVSTSLQGGPLSRLTASGSPPATQKAALVLVVCQVQQARDQVIAVGGRFLPGEFPRPGSRVHRVLPGLEDALLLLTHALEHTLGTPMPSTCSGLAKASEKEWADNTPLVKVSPNTFTWRCPRCKKRNDEGDTTCIHCGQDVRLKS